MVDIVASHSDVTISLEFSEDYLCETDAQGLIHSWANVVQELLHIVQ